MSPRAGSRALTRLNSDATITREELAEALVSSTDPKERQLGKMLNSYDTKWRNLTVAGLAHRCGVGYDAIMRQYKEFKRLQSVVAIAREMPAIAADIAEDAKNKTVTCATCGGTGSVSAGDDKDGQTIVKRCIPCEGKGKITQRGDKDSRKMALEIMELVGRGATTIDARGSNVAVVSGDGSLEEMLKRARSQRQSAAGTMRAEVQDGRTIDMDGGVGPAPAEERG